MEHKRKAPVLLKRLSILIGTRTLIFKLQIQVLSPSKSLIRKSSTNPRRRFIYLFIMKKGFLGVVNQQVSSIFDIAQGGDEILTLELKKSNNNESVSGKLIINASTNVTNPIGDAFSRRGLEAVEDSEDNPGSSSSSAAASSAGIATVPKPSLPTSGSRSNLPSNEDHLGPLPTGY
jgi:hypothetical protein